MKVHMRNFVKIKSSRNGEIPLSLTDIDESWLSHDFLTSQICVLTLFPKIKLSQKKTELTIFFSSAVFCKLRAIYCLITYV